MLLGVMAFLFLFYLIPGRPEEPFERFVFCATLRLTSIVFEQPWSCSARLSHFIDKVPTIVCLGSLVCHKHI